MTMADGRIRPHPWQTMGSTLMVNRPAGGDRSKKWPKEPLDWYREGPRVVQQLMHGIDFGNDVIFDPCCGAGNVLDVAKARGHPTFGADLVNRGARHPFSIANALTNRRIPRIEGRQTSIISNTPYSYEDDIAERIMMHCVEALPVRRAAFIVPIAFLAGQERWGRILPPPDGLGRYRPSHTCIYRERHTMPPGSLIDQMAKPYEGGMADYAAIVFTRPHRDPTLTVWLRPGHH